MIALNDGPLSRSPETNLKLIEREGMPTHPAIVATFTDNIARLEKVKNAR